MLECTSLRFHNVPGALAPNGYPARAGESGIPRRPLCRTAAFPVNPNNNY